MIRIFKCIFYGLGVSIILLFLYVAGIIIFIPGCFYIMYIVLTTIDDFKKQEQEKENDKTK